MALFLKEIKWLFGNNLVLLGFFYSGRVLFLIFIKEMVELIVKYVIWVFYKL